MPQGLAANAAFVERPVNAAEKLIVALDVESVADAREIADQLDGIVSFFKIGLALQWDEDLRGFIDELLNVRRCQVFLDYKYGDIGSVLRRGIAGVANLGVDFLTIQGAGDIGEKDLRMAASARSERKQQLKIFLVTVLTSLDQHDLDEIGVSETILDRVVRRAQIAHRAGLDGVIASGQEAAEIRAATAADFLIITPGIRPSGAPHDDHKRVSTPYQAIANGADYLVVGRPITENVSPQEAAEAIIAEMQGAFDSLC
jgi:orotidine-5'-phosphate decarboxylase